MLTKDCEYSRMNFTKAKRLLKRYGGGIFKKYLLETVICRKNLQYLKIHNP